MNAMIRVVKGTLAILALAGLGLLLRWMTAGAITGLRTYDLDSLTVLAVGTIAWIAYGWLVLAVVLTVLEQIPGMVGTLAGAVAGRITTKTARALLRSGLGVAAVTPLTISAAHATPDTTHVRQWAQPQSKVQSDGKSESYRGTEPRSTVQLGGTGSSYRATEPASTVELGAEAEQRRTDGTAPRRHTDSYTDNYRATEPASTVEIGNTPATTQDNTDYRATEPPSKVQLGGPTPTSTDKPTTLPPPNRPQPTGRPSGGSARVGVPDRPTDGAPTRYTELRAAVPVRVVVREGDSLWSIAARELGPDATTEAIAARWPDWYAANRHVIGNDPDLILPGQVLRIPPHHQEP